MTGVGASPGDRDGLCRTEPRERCLRCLRVASRCVCGLLTPIDNATEVLIVQHRREHGHPFGTARLAELGLRRCILRTVWNLDRLDQDFGLASDAVLLYPGDGAAPIESLALRGAPSQLVVVDGTWHQARALLRDHAALRALPRVALAPSAPSRYRIRQEPSAMCVSTVEAVVQALRVLEPELDGLDGLLWAFESMIDWQLDSVSVKRARFSRPRARRGFGLPEPLRAPRERIAVVYAEATAPAWNGQARHAQELLQLCVKPLGGSSAQSVLFRGQTVPSPRHLAHMGISPDDLQQARPLSAAPGWLLQAVGDASLLVGWNRSVMELAAPLVPHLEPLVLKAAFCNAVRGPSGVLEQLASRLGLCVEPAKGVLGRAATRLAACEAVLEWLLAGAEGASGIPNALGV